MLNGFVNNFDALHPNLPGKLIQTQSNFVKLAIKPANSCQTRTKLLLLFVRANMICHVPSNNRSHLCGQILSEHVCVHELAVHTCKRQRDSV